MVVEVFFSYAHADEPLRDQLAKHLSLLQHQGLIAAWHDRCIRAGSEWSYEIDMHLQTARVILLLVSADFLASQYCYAVEMQHAMARHEAGDASVIPIILRAVDWHKAPFGKLQALPTDGKPVTSWLNRDEAWTNVVHGIRLAVEALMMEPPPERSRERDATGRPTEAPMQMDNRSGGVYGPVCTQGGDVVGGAQTKTIIYKR